MSDRRQPYDLATAAGDFPPWEGRPQRSVVLCSHPRSGSTLLGEAIFAAGGLGCPLEYLHRGFRPALAARWAAPDLASFTSAVHRHRTDTSGVLAMKLFWRDVEETWSEATGQQAGGTTDAAQLFGALTSLLPDPTFVYLRRRDRVRLAVSAYIATMTSSFRRLPGDVAPATVVAYDYDAILRQLAVADYSNARWQEFFELRGVSPLVVEYEDLASDYTGTASRVLAFLGRPVAVDQPRMQRQASRQSEEFVWRFLTDHSRVSA
jgi:trehalose 2-sulfotransferase